MERQAREVVVIGAGIAGLCAAVYAQKCGYRVTILAMHESAGGLATSWHRGGYTFETCLHWLLGSNPQTNMYRRWQEVFDIGRLSFVDHDEYVRVETQAGESLHIYADLDRLEAELLSKAPQDAAEIRRLVSHVRRLADLDMPEAGDMSLRNLPALLHQLPALLLVHRLSHVSSKAYARRFRHPLLQGFIGGSDLTPLCAIALIFSMAWISERNGGYPIGGSQAVIRLIVETFLNLGGNLRFGAKVESILVARDRAVGVKLSGGETIAADWVISAADGHATIYDLLGGKYRDENIDRIYERFEPFPSYLQVSLGVARDLSDEPAFLELLLDAPLKIDPKTQIRDVTFRFFHFDPSFAPPGKTALTCFLPTRNCDYWIGLRQSDPALYESEKHRVAEAVVTLLERRIKDIRKDIEVTDVATPATVIRYTGNWQGSMEGWLLTPRTGLRPLRQSLPGLERFLMAGQWVMPGGGLPSGLMTARLAVRAMCKQDRIVFLGKA